MSGVDIEYFKKKEDANYNSSAPFAPLQKGDDILIYLKKEGANVPECRGEISKKKIKIKKHVLLFF